MRSNEAAYAALNQWNDSRYIQGFSAPGDDTADDGFLAGFEAGAEHIRRAVLHLWDENDAWIPGADYTRLAAALGVEPSRVKSYRTGGRSRPKQSIRSRNIPIG
jgi:hypothetical protein